MTYVNQGEGKKTEKKKEERNRPDGPIKHARGNRHVRSLLIGYSGLLIGHSIARFYYTGRQGGAAELDEPVTMASLTRVIISSTEIARRIIMLIKWRFFVCLFPFFLRRGWGGRQESDINYSAALRHMIWNRNLPRKVHFLTLKQISLSRFLIRRTSASRT